MYGNHMHHASGGGMHGPPPPHGMMGANIRGGGVPGVVNQQPNMGGMNVGNVASAGQQQKHDIFVGNLAFSTTEEQLHQVFSEVGRLVKVRMVSDLDTGKPRGFAFVEFEDPTAALAAIKNLNDFELNGRRLRVNFSNSSHLETLANRLGMDMSQHTSQRSGRTTNDGSSGGAMSTDDGAGDGTQAVSSALRTLSKVEMYDVISQLKAVADRDPDEARRLLCGHPQLPEAVLHLMSKLEMIKTPLTIPPSTPGMAPPPPVPPPQPPKPPIMPQQPPPPQPPRAADPRTRAVDPRAAATAPPTDPRAAARVDPRTRVADPRTAAPTAAQQSMPVMNVPPPPMSSGPPPAVPGQPMQFSVPPPLMSMPPPGSQPQQQQPGVANLDPSLVQQVMSLTPQMIQQLPPDKQQSIMALRQQITGGR